MINKPLAELAESDLQELITNKVVERKSLEYKQEIKIKADGEKKEFLADISSMANATGGDLIFGLACDPNTGEPTTLAGIPEINADAQILTIENLIRDGIRPRLTCESQAIKLTNGNLAICIRVPQSWSSPHMVTFGGSLKFYTRGSNGKYPMDVDELRNAFTYSERLSEQISSFRADRIGKIYSNDTFYPLNNEGLVVLHIIPVSAFNRNFRFPFSDIKTVQKHIKTIGASGWDYIFNIDGYMAFSRYEYYTQVFKNGIIEAVDPTILTSRAMSEEAAIYPEFFEKETIGAYTEYMNIYKKLRVEGPFVIALTLIHVKNYRFFSKKIIIPSLRQIKNTREVIKLPEVLVSDYTIPAEVALKPIFDTLWNAFGYEKSGSYDANGSWSYYKGVY